MVRQLTLDQPIRGSNPLSPANRNSSLSSSGTLDRFAISPTAGVHDAGAARFGRKIGADEMTIAAIRERLTSRPEDLRPLLVAIDGHSCAGKSTLASDIAAATGAAIVEGDDFYAVMSPSDREILSPEEGYRRYFDWRRLRTALRSVQRSGQTRYRRYDWASNKLDGWRVVHSARLVLVDGIYSSRRQLAEIYDLKVFVDTPIDTCRARALARGENQGGWVDRWLAAEQQYMTIERPRERADVVVSGLGASSSAER